MTKSPAVSKKPAPQSSARPAQPETPPAKKPSPKLAKESPGSAPTLSEVIPVEYVLKCRLIVPKGTSRAELERLAQIHKPYHGMNRYDNGVLAVGVVVEEAEVSFKKS
jgi:hypothetical protein